MLNVCEKQTARNRNTKGRKGVAYKPSANSEASESKVSSLLRMTSALCPFLQMMSLIFNLLAVTEVLDFGEIKSRSKQSGNFPTWGPRRFAKIF